MSAGDEYARRMESFYGETLHPWGVEPDEFLVAHAGDLLPGTVLDLGAGDGRDALFLARHGFRVVAVDLVDAALAELRRAASAENLAVETHVADIGSFPLAETYENVVSTFMLHFLPWDVATDLVVRAKDRTAPGGCHLLSIFTKDGPLYRRGSPAFWLEPGGLRALYDGWEVLHEGSRVVETVARDAAGNPFRQPTDELVARRPAGRSA